MTTADDVIAYASSLAGLTADPSRPECRAAYIALVAPGETPQRAAELSTLWNCELVCRAVLRRFIARPRLDAPYVDGMAGRDLMAIAREAHALRPMHALPQAGDIVLVSSPEHAWTCLTAVPSPYEEGVTLCDGLDGLPVDGHRAIIVRAHEVRQGRDNAGGDRAIVAVIDTMACVAAFGR